MRENCADLGMNVPLGMGKFTQAISLGMGTRPVPKWVPMSRSNRVCTLLHRPSPSPILLSAMTTFHFNGQQLNNDLVASISSLLDAINVPNLLWGNYLLTVYGVPTIVDVSILSRNDWFSKITNTVKDVSFVVPDALIEISFSTIAEAGFHLCSRYLDCPHSNSPTL